MREIFYHIDEFCAGWQSKIACSSTFAFADGLFNDFGVLTGKGIEGYTNLFGGDSVVLIILLVLLCADLVFNVLCSLVKGEFRISLLIRGMIKFLLYLTYVVLVAGVSTAIDRSLGVQSALLLNLFVLYLITCAGRSIIRNMQRIGIRVPAPLVFMMKAFSSWIESLFHKLILRRTGKEERIENKRSKERGDK